MNTSTIIEFFIVFLIVVINTIIVYELGFSKGRNSIKIKYDRFLQRLCKVAIKENWNIKEVTGKIYDFRSGRNPSSFCVAKECCPNQSEDCIDCGYNYKTKRKIQEQEN